MVVTPLEYWHTGLKSRWKCKTDWIMRQTDGLKQHDSKTKTWKKRKEGKTLRSVVELAHVPGVQYLGRTKGGSYDLISPTSARMFS